jgi:hypothetical protein
MGSNQQFLQPNNYDPRRLFPFGLSPIPEVPSELASEVSSIASYSPTPTLDDSDTEIESVRSRGSIMYSGSCDSVKSNVTLHGKTSSASSTDTEQDSSEDDEEEDECYKIQPLAKDCPEGAMTVQGQPDTSTNSFTQESATVDAVKSYSNSEESSSIKDSQNDIEYAEYEEEEEEEDSSLTQIDGLRAENPSFPCDMVSGAATASEIFRHLQATRGKQEVTTELAKILTVLKTTLSSNDKDTSSSDEESGNTRSKSSSKSSDPVITGKPPKPPKQIKFSKNSVISPAIQARIRELEQNKPGNPKEEMNLLSKILVHLLCSCKTTAAAQELKRIIRQFKEVAKVAMEEGGCDDNTDPFRSSSRTSSRNSRRKIRSRTASGNSNISGNSETDSMNTLTPGDSKSSGTDDEAAQDGTNVTKLRFTSDVNVGNQFPESDTHTISYTLTIPLKKVYAEEVDKADNNNHDEDDEEWEWEYEEEEGSPSPCSKNNSSGSSRNQTPSEGKSDISTGSTRKILMEMEMGAYNSGSTSHSDQGNSQSTPITEEDDAIFEDEEEKGKVEKFRKKQTEKLDGSGHLFCHLEETFKVLSDTYQIITTGNSPENQSRATNYTPSTPEKVPMDKTFEDILDGVTNKCVQLESEIMRSSRQSTATPDNKDFQGTEQSTTQDTSTQRLQRTSSRPSSRTSRPVSRQKTKTPVNNDQEEEWGDDDEWEYYYEEDYPENPEIGENTENYQKSPNASRPGSRIIIRSRPVSRQSYQATDTSTNVAVSPKQPSSRPNSRIIIRVPSRAASRPPSKVKGDISDPKEDEDWGDDDEWEYYYEEDYPEEQESNDSERKNSPLKPSSRPSSRPASRQKVPEEVCNAIRAHSRLSDQGTKVVLKSQSGQVMMIRSESRQDTDSKRVPSRNMSRASSRPTSRPASRAKSEQKGDAQGEDWGDEDEWEYYYEEDYPEEEEPANHSAQVNAGLVINPAPEKIIQIIKVKSRPSSRQSLTSSRPSSRTDSRPVSRATSRTASRIKRTTSSLGNVDEEDEGDWYLDDCEDAELRCLSPSLTTAPTTRATSPFPDEKGKVDVNTGTGFSRRKLTFIKETEETSPVSRTPTNRDSVTGSITPKCSGNVDRIETGSKTPSFSQKGYLNSMAGVSVALAAEYLGQDAEELVASLPAKFIEDNHLTLKEKKKKHKHKQKCQDDEEDEKGEGKEKRKKKKEKDGKFLPKVGVKELASRLEPHLFQDSQAGKKMLITKEEVRDVIRESKKRNTIPVTLNDSPKLSSNSMKVEEKRKSVREMVQLMSNQSQKEDMGYCETMCTVANQTYGIPSISMTSSMCPQQAVPSLPTVFYSAPSPQFSQSPYQHYPVEMHAQYTQYPQSPYQPYAPQPPPTYQQYNQPYYQGYPHPPPPPPQPPQQFQQYSQPYPAFHSPMQPYHPGYQAYGVQPMVYQSETNPGQMKVVSGGLTTIVNMRQKSNISPATPRQSLSQAKTVRSPRNSPEGSEAYGTGSSGSDQTEGQAAGIDHDDGGGAEQEDVGSKPNKRHSRLFKLLQDSDYTDSDNDSRTDFSRISMKNVEDNHSRESDIDSICSGLERTGVERKHSFRSHKSSNKESDNESISSGIERKISPNSVQNNIKHRRFMQLNLQTNYEPSSSELSTPNSPTGMGPSERKRSTSKPPPSRVWNYHADDFDSHAGVSDDSSYQSLQSLNSFDSIYDNIAGREVEEIMKRKVNSSGGLYRYQTESPSTFVRASPKSVDLLRGSPKTHSSSSPKLENYNRASPKLEQELLELTNFPSSPGLSLMQLHGHRNFYSTGK